MLNAQRARGVSIHIYMYCYSPGNEYRKAMCEWEIKLWQVMFT